MVGASGSVSVREFTRVCDQVDGEAEAALSGVFAQHRSWVMAMAYVAALGRDDVPVKTCWDLSQAAGLTRPRPFQSLVGECEWDHHRLWDGIAGWASRVLTCPADDRLGPGIAVDETAQAKRGVHTAGVGVQYAGFAGATINCVTSVVASLVTPGASTWVANDLFLQEKQWFTGDGAKGLARRRAAGIDEAVQFASKPQIARRELAHLRALGVGFTWAAGDEVYGRSSALGKDHEDHREAYAYFVPRDFHFLLPGGTPVRADEMLHNAQGHFEERSAGPGLNGPRWYQWAILATASPEHFLLVRRAADTPTDPPPPTPAAASSDGHHHGAEPGRRHSHGAVSDPHTADLPPGTGFMYCHLPAGGPIAPTLANLVLMIGRRWPVEETIAAAKGPIGWDDNQFRTYTSLERHAALCALAMLRVVAIRGRLEEQASGPTQTLTGPPSSTAGPTAGPTAEPDTQAPARHPDETRIPIADAATPCHPDQPCPAHLGWIRLSLAETLRLINVMTAHISAAGKQFLLDWSTWRREHQAIARWYHRRARLALATAGTHP
jgi:SRSO17 transposase